MVEEKVSRILLLGGGNGLGENSDSFRLARIPHTEELVPRKLGVSSDDFRRTLNQFSLFGE